MILDIELERDCGYCKGTGLERLTYANTLCEFCNGLGQEITTEGRKLIQFLAKYYDIEPKMVIRNNLGTFDNPARDHL